MRMLLTIAIRKSISLNAIRGIVIESILLSITNKLFIINNKL